MRREKASGYLNFCRFLDGTYSEDKWLEGVRGLKAEARAGKKTRRAGEERNHTLALKQKAQTDFTDESSLRWKELWKARGRQP